MVYTTATFTFVQWCTVVTGGYSTGSKLLHFWWEQILQRIEGARPSDVTKGIQGVFHGCVAFSARKRYALGV